MCTAFHPQTDGQAEKANSIVDRYLRAYTASRQGEWDQLLALAEIAYNASRLQSLEMSPFEADLGYIPRMPLDAVAAVTSAGSAPRRSPRGHLEPAPDDRSFAVQMADVLSQLKRPLQHAQDQQIAEPNRHRQPHTFQQGDNVLLSTKNLPITYATAKDDHPKTLQEGKPGGRRALGVRGEMRGR
jgi:hypothetical protein